jgi:cysteine-rich repeat protein
MHERRGGGDPDPCVSDRTRLTNGNIRITVLTSTASLWTFAVGTLQRCGNGVVETGEQCDDGNQSDGDGCSATCQSELISGGSAKNDCLHEWFAGAVAARDRKGLPRNRIECTDDDPTCDFGADENACTFHVEMCLNVTDQRFSCPAADVAQVSLKKPNQLSPGDAIDEANRKSLEDALAGLGGVIRGQCTNRGPKHGQLCVVNTDCDTTPGSGVCKGRFVAFDPPFSAADRCTSVTDIKVPLRTTTRGLRTGRKALTLAVTPSKDPVTGRRRASDRDSLTLV